VTAVNLDAVYGNDVVGAVGDAGAKAHHDACIALMSDQEPAVQTECTVHDRPSPFSRYLRHLKVRSGQLGADSVPLDLTGTIPSRVVREGRPDRGREGKRRDPPPAADTATLFVILSTVGDIAFW